MNLRRTAALALTAAIGLTLAPAHADDEVCTVSVDEASAAAPQVIDQTNDWTGPVLGNGGTGLGDVYREGTDLKAAWLARAADGHLEAHIQLVSVSKMQPNAIYYFAWTYGGGDPIRAQRFVSARLKGYGEGYSYGYFGAPLTPTSNGTFVTIGDTTGHVVEGANGEIVVDLPFGGTGEDRQTGTTVSNDPWGKPASGSTLSLQPAGVAPYGPEARVLVGSPEPLPPPSPLRHGNVYVADLPENATQLCDATV